MNILILNGPNLNLLDQRSEKYYGSFSLKELEENIRTEFPNQKFEFFQSNHEGELIDKIQSASNTFDGLIINPGGFSHTSVAIRDALEICTIPKIEVHISNISRRENFRQTLVTASSCDGYICGFRKQSYIAGIFLLSKIASSSS